MVSAGAGVVEVTEDTSDVRLAPQPATDEGSGSGCIPVLKAPNDIHMPKASAVRNPTMVPCQIMKTKLSLAVYVCTYIGQNRRKADQIGSPSKTVVKPFA